MATAPLYVIRRLAWDETGEKMVYDDATTGIASVWHVMVARCRIIVAWPGESGNVVFDWTMVSPPIIVPKPAASDIYYALYHSPFLRPIMYALYLLMQRASVAVDVSETDDASSNSRLEAHLLSKCLGIAEAGGKEVLKAHMVCRLHQQQLAEVLLLAVAGAWVMNRLFSFSTLMKTGNTYIHTVQELGHLLRSPGFVVVPGRVPPASAKDFCVEMRRYIWTNRGRFNKSQENSHWMRYECFDYESESEADGEGGAGAHTKSRGFQHEWHNKTTPRN